MCAADLFVRQIEYIKFISLGPFVCRPRAFPVGEVGRRISLPPKHGTAARIYIYIYAASFSFLANSLVLLLHSVVFSFPHDTYMHEHSSQ
jgi:hypothetical protein